MALLLNIDTATETGSIALSNNSTIIGEAINQEQKDHARWIHNAISEMMKNAGKALHELDAVAVTAGPGSYTGLRVGMATAKGICYVLKLPLITESTLKVMAYAAVELSGEGGKPWFCPMIDARRMEVYTALYDVELNELVKPQPMVLDENSFRKECEENEVIFFGSGSAKFKALVQPAPASFIDVRYTANHLAHLAGASFFANNFTDLAYAEPAYLKEFYTHTKK
jgi:tRNA threonylcarbamoyladenosine biosynthesis protein TsaB